MRLGVDIGGTKIEVAALEGAGAERLRRRIPTPHGAYEPALEALAQLILQAESEAQERCTVGVGMPGVISPDTGLLANAYNTPYNGRALKPDLERILRREIRFANDANCFALSEALDVAAPGARLVISRDFKVSTMRGRFVASPLAPRVFATFHPSALLRLKDEKEKQAAFEQLVGDLKLINKALR